jgi:hypothetical protein
MTQPLRSADLLVKNALTDPAALAALKADPENTLKRLSAEAVSQLPPPDPPTANIIWLIIIAAFSIAMLYAVYILGSGVTHAAVASPITKSDTILTIFTTTTAFLAGLLSPSPVKK